MNKYNAIRLLSLFVLGASLLGINNAFAATTVTIDTPTTGNSVNDSDLVGWSWDTDATDGTIVFTQTGGSADPNSPHTYTMNAGDLLAAGNPHTLTILDKTLEDLSVAVDEQGNTWNLDGNLWMKEYKSPENLQTQLDKINREIEALRATDHFDSNTIQGELEPSKTHVYPNYGRGHDPVPNMKNAFIDYILSKPGTVNHSSYRLD